MVKYMLITMFAAMALAGGIAAAETIQGISQSAGVPGLVEITVQGDPIPRTGILISPSLALTSRGWTVSNPDPRSVTVAHGHGSNRQPVTKVATDIWPHPGLPLALVRVSSGFSNVPPVSYATDRPAVGADLVCYGFSQGLDLKRAELRVADYAGFGYIAVSRARTDMILDDGAGMPCFLAHNGHPTNTLTGIAENTFGRDFTEWKHHQRGAYDFKDWIPNMIHLSKVRSTGARAMSLYTRPNPHNPNQRMCLDIANRVDAHAPVHQRSCIDPNQNSSFRSQLFYFHNFPDSRNPQVTHYTIVHQNSGMCLTIPNSSTTRGVKVQQSPCNQGLNQDWNQSFYQPRPPEGIKFLQVRSNLCLSAPAPPNHQTHGLPVEQNACQNSATNFYQRWFIKWK